MRTLRLFALSLLLASFALASTVVSINFTGLPANTYAGHYVGWSQATITNGTDTLFSYDLMCDDFAHTTNIPSGPFTYYVSTLPTLTDNRWTQSPELTNYQVAAILLWQFDGLGIPVTNTQAGSYNYAIWNLFNPSTGHQGNSASLLSTAQAIVAGTNHSMSSADIQHAYDNLRVFTPTNANLSQQEFLGITSTPFDNPPGVPEPATYMMLGTGLIGLAAFARKRHPKQ